MTVELKSQPRRSPMRELRNVLLPIILCFVIRSAVADAHGQSKRLSRRQTFSTCKYDVDCIENAYCRNQQTCSCKENHIEYRSNNNYRCLRVATHIGDPCEEDIQCEFTFTPQSECREGTCQCAHDSHFTDGRCYESIGLGKRCRSNRNCYIKNTFCEYGFCKCGLRHHANPENTGCLPSAKLGELCKSDDECIVENSKCIENKCDCKVNYVLAESGQRCLRVATQIDEECEQQSQCRFKHSQCSVNKTCDCVVGSHRRGHLCFVDVELGGRCEIHHHCITGTFKDSNLTWKSKVDCVEGFCACTEGYTLMDELQDCIQFSDNGATIRQIHGILLIIFIAKFLVR
ncbi:prion-like-(Q/N-rich) domain-bearing protein 25 isoform X2 [Linepithema humile]|uniref:prion-like-(Q/N-rich) domain-bearing protein 25 isoform X2 n=1 Tax=Linepithema humile TaxID=83485 RepID=UPI0006238FF6|nr:PREDICTED: uncharacterized protein DDB_G0272420-like isoform X2 [Linepithema humile]